MRIAEGGACLRIAILGTRGIPGSYGGFETFAEEFGSELAARGHDVTVYGRTSYVPRGLRTHRGVRLVRLPAIPQKHAETLSHTLLSALHAALRSYDVVYVCNSANAPICYIPWLRRQPTVLNVDGLEWRRSKWGRLARSYYRFAARLAARMPIEVVTDARVIQDYYRDQLGRETKCFVYGTTLWDRNSLADRLGTFGLEPDRFLLYVSRMEPENNALMVVEAFRRVETDMPLVMVGDAPYAREYVERVKSAADARVHFPGYVFGDDYHALGANAYLYIQATEVGGTHPALVEAMGHRNAVVAHDVPEHREVVGDAGRYFAYRDTHDLTAQLADLVGNPRAVEEYRRRAGDRVVERYGWAAVTSEYLTYFDELVHRGGRTPRNGG
jgi:glycosyltransferase involved in cell wall biosynthesis